MKWPSAVLSVTPRQMKRTEGLEFISGTEFSSGSCLWNYHEVQGDIRLLVKEAIISLKKQQKKKTEIYEGQEKPQECPNELFGTLLKKKESMVSQQHQ